jgi:hypothetical protein
MLPSRRQEFVDLLTKQIEKILKPLGDLVRLTCGLATAMPCQTLDQASKPLYIVF